MSEARRRALDQLTQLIMPSLLGSKSSVGGSDDDDGKKKKKKMMVQHEQMEAVMMPKRSAKKEDGPKAIHVSIESMLGRPSASEAKFNQAKSEKPKGGYASFKRGKRK